MSDLIFPDFHLPTKLYIRPDVLRNSGAILSGMGSRAVIIITSADFDRLEKVLEIFIKSLNYAGIGTIVFDEIPTVANTEYIDSAVFFTKKTNCDLVIGFGGTESINAAKAVALLTNNYLFCEDLYENPEVKPPLNFVTIPSNPLYGQEILPMFIATDIHTGEKKVYQHNYLYPHASIIDPGIAIYASDETTVQTGMASIALSTESIISKVTSEFTNTYALKSIDLLFKHLENAYRDNHNPSLRYPISVASVLAGTAFSLSALSVTMSISCAIASKTATPIEKWMGLILPHVMEFNLTSSPGKYVQMAKVMDEDVKEITVIEAAIKAIEGVRRIGINLDIPQRLSSAGITKNEFKSIAEIAVKYPFMENAPRVLNSDEIETILIAAY